MQTFWNQRFSAARRYLVAVVCVLAAFGVRYWLTPVLGEELPFMLFIAAALVAAWYGGAATGMAALMLGLLLASYFFVPARAGTSTSLELFRLIRYLFTATLGVILIEVLHRGRRRTEAAITNLQQEAAHRERTERALLAAQSQLRAHAAELEQHVAERTARLATTVQSLEGMLHHIAHNFRAPLRAIAIYSAILLGEHPKELSARAKECCHNISEAAQRMDSLIHDLLEFGELSRADVPLRAVNLEEVVQRARECLAARAEQTQAEIELTGPFPDVQANPTILKRVIIHLLDNALKFVAPGTTPRVRLWTEKRDSGLRLWVEDNGIGIDARYHQRVFEAFETLHPAEVYEGNGIGLAIVKQGMQRMGGKAGVLSGPGAGSRFWIEFPAPDPSGREEKPRTGVRLKALRQVGSPEHTRPGCSLSGNRYAP